MEDLGAQEQEIINIILIAIGLFLFMAVAIVLFFYFSRRKIIKAELDKANLKITFQKQIIQSTLVTQEEERKRIAQDLHDAISSKLNIVSLNANFLTDANISVEETHKLGKSILGVTTTVLESSRRIAHDLLPPTLEKFGLAAAMEELCDDVSESGSFKLIEEIDYVLDTLSKDNELHLFRIAQELLNNTIKYSEATQIDLKLFHEKEQLIFSYADNGKGFNIDKAIAKKGLGMSGIENRAAILNAKYKLEAAPGKGISLRLEI